MKTVLINHNDSFTYNIVETIKQIGLTELIVVNHKNATIDLIKSFDNIILSPGPSVPSTYQNTIKMVSSFYTKKPILGICLGHQLLAEFFGASLENLSTVNHGIQEEIQLLTTSKLFKNIKNKTKVGLYHSWCINSKSLPESLKITSTLKNGLVTSFEHKKLPIYGIQFHPESFLSMEGKQLLTNFLSL